jgi:hypothetical protein
MSDRFWRVIGLAWRATLGVPTRVRREGIIISKRGRNSGQHASMIAVLICAYAQITSVTVSWVKPDQKSMDWTVTMRTTATKIFLRSY